MSVQKINVLVHPVNRLTPGAAWIADAVIAFAVSAAALVAGWRQRAAHEAKARSIARDRCDLQRLAAQYMATQPSFAKELMAVAMIGTDD
jgi:hypothetical protein